MKQEIKAKWVAALRSGEYSQTQGRLKDDQGFCCLGVLCDLHAREKGLKWEGTSTSPTYCGSRFVPSLEVVEWACLESVELDGYGVKIDGEEATLTMLNDQGTPFSEIADLIEDQY